MSLLVVVVEADVQHHDPRHSHRLPAIAVTPTTLNPPPTHQARQRRLCSFWGGGRVQYSSSRRHLLQRRRTQPARSGDVLNRARGGRRRSVVIPIVEKEEGLADQIT